MCVKQPEALNTEFEQHLTEALRPVAAPDGFADRVMARVHSPAAARAKVVTMPLRARPWIGGAIAAVLLVGVYTGVHTGEQAHQRRERERAERAQQQFDAGMRITDQTLEHVRLQLQQAGIGAGE
jgi:hypothetical protein